MEPGEAPGGEEPTTTEATQPSGRGRVTAPPLLEGPLELLRAVVLGIRDTAKDVAEGARAEARAAYDERWARFEALTKGRRKPRAGRSRD